MDEATEMTPVDQEEVPNASDSTQMTPALEKSIKTEEEALEANALPPNRFIIFLVQHPYIVAITVFSLLVILSGAGMYFAPLNFESDGSWFPRDEIRVTRSDALTELQTLKGEEPDSFQKFYIIFYYFSSERTAEPLDKQDEDPDLDASDSGKNIFREPTMTTIRDFENAVVDAKDFEKFCNHPPGDDTICSPSSRLSLIPSVFANNGTGAWIGDSAVDTLLSNNSDILVYSTTAKRYVNGKDKDLFKSTLSFSTKVGTTTRAERSLKFNSFVEEHIWPIVKNGFTSEGKYSNKDIRLGYFGNGLLEVAFTELIYTDMALFSGSVFLVGFLLFYHTNSIFLTLTGLFQTVLAFPTTHFFIYVVGPYSSPSAFAIMSLFVILGIGADDIFLLYDAFQQSHSESAGLVNRNLESKLYWAWSRAAHAMFVTTITTFAAFFGAALSQIPAISIFGLFTAVMIALNFLAVITFFPACLVIYHMNGWDNLTNCFSCCKSTNPGLPCIETIYPHNHPQHTSQIKHQEDLLEHESHGDTDHSFGHLFDETVSDAIKQDIVDQLGKSEKFYYSIFGPFMQKYYKQVLGVMFLVVVGSIVAATFVQTAESQGSGIPADNPISFALLLETNVFPVAGNSFFALNMNQVFGVDRDDPITRTGPNGEFLDPNDLTVLGIPNLVNLDMDDPVKHGAMYEAVMAYTNDTKVFDIEHSDRCILDVFREYWNGTWPIPTNFTNEMSAFLADSNYTVDGDYTILKYPRFINIKDGKIEWFYCSFLTHVDEFKPSIINKYYYDEYLPLESKTNKDYLKPANVPLMYGSSPTLTWMASIDILLQSAVSNIFISLALTVLILLIMTRSITLTILATFSIAMVVVTLLAYMAIGGVYLDIISNINLIISVGISVDYTVHFAIAFQEMSSKDKKKYPRKLRALYSMTVIGVSIFAGYLTTFFAIFALFFAFFNFFWQFGEIFAILISFSIFYSHFLFLPLAMVFGPEEHKMSWTQVKDKILGRGTESESEDAEK